MNGNVPVIFVTVPSEVQFDTANVTFVDASISNFRPGSLTRLH
jgi:hypothetical protein